MIRVRIFLILVVVASFIATFASWYWLEGFKAWDARWWDWLFRYTKATGGFPEYFFASFLIVMVVSLAVMFIGVITLQSPSTRTIFGGRDARESHGSARWAKWRDIKLAGILAKNGVTVGAFRKLTGAKTLKHDGPEHVLAFAPTRSGKGVSLVLPTLLEWQQSALVLDIKGENYALTAGYRQSLGHNIYKFDPASETGSHCYNPLVEVRIGTNHEIADAQNIASMVIDPDGKGLKDYWSQSGWEWLAASLLHVIYRVQKRYGRDATLGDVHNFMSAGQLEGEDIEIEAGEAGFDQILQDMIDYDHGSDSVNNEVKRAASAMLVKAHQERSGVHSNAKVALALYSDPIVAKNISKCDFRIADLMNGDNPTSLYIVLPPSDIQRLRPLVRILFNQILTRLTAEMEFEAGSFKKTYKHRLLLMLDEFTALGKLEIFEKALAFMAGYGLKAFIIIQDLAQLQKEYSKEESIVSNCHVRIAFAPNKIETAEYLSKMTGITTIQQNKTSRSYGGPRGFNISESVNEVQRPLLTPGECMQLPGAIKRGKSMTPGHMLIFVAGNPPVYGEQRLFYQDKQLVERSRLEPPVKGTAHKAIDYDHYYNEAAE